MGGGEIENTSQGQTNSTDNSSTKNKKSEAVYTCNNCKDQFTSNGELIEHIMFKHQGHSKAYLRRLEICIAQQKWELNQK